MKKVLLLFGAVIMMLITSAQNGGQEPENNVVKITKVSSTQLTVTVAVVNKQNCEADYQASYGNLVTNYTIPANSQQLIVITVNGNTKFKVKALTACISQPDMGWVELELLQYLPVKFGQIQIKLIKSRSNQ